MKKEEVSGVLGIDKHGRLIHFWTSDIVIGVRACYRTGQVKYLNE
jgi:hypothetical protein